MLPSPDSSPRPALANRTNVPPEFSASNLNPWFAYPTPPEHDRAVAKRPSHGADGWLQKRVKLNPKHEKLGVPISSNEDVDMCDLALAPTMQRKHTMFYTMNAAVIGRPPMMKRSLTTRPILQSFVSSHKSDVFKCLSVDTNTFLSPPYACAYSSEAKRGGIPLLAVATEQGSVHILNTTKRQDWEVEPARTILQPHSNGVFDIKWNLSDSLLATCSGDRYTCISCPSTSTSINTLRGHTSTVKCVAWDPNHSNLLSTGGRDGVICVWDLRVGKRQTPDGMDVTEDTTSPVLVIPGASGEEGRNAKTKTRKGKSAPPVKSVTSLAYSSREPYCIINSGSLDGLLRSWDTRLPKIDKKNTTLKPLPPLFTSPFDPTSLHGSRRPRGLTSFALGTGPTAGLLFALGADSRVHTYTVSELTPQTQVYAHENMQTNSFYVRVGVSPCGNWLASGSNATGSVFLYDVSNALRPSKMSPSYASVGVELRGQQGEVGAVDWAEGMLATCADDGSIRVWRPDVDVYRRCVEEPEEGAWDWVWSRSV